MSNYCMRCGKPSDDSTAPCLCHLLNKESNALVNPHFCEPRGCPTPGACSAAARIAELEAAIAASEKDAARWQDRAEKAGTAVALFARAIKLGENWSPMCEAMLTQVNSAGGGGSRPQGHAHQLSGIARPAPPYRSKR